jgi:hypothetical protein
MICSPEESILLSSRGWIDGASLWCFDVSSRRESKIRLSEAKWLSLHTGNGPFFSVVHHFEDGKIQITAHSFDSPAEVLSRASIDADHRRIEGDTAAWQQLPHSYVAYYANRGGADFALIRTNGS